MEKQAVSLMLSYVMIISIAIGISAGVYLWLKDYANVSPAIDCKEGTSLILEEYNCTGNYLNILVKNNGLFNISGFILAVGNNTKRIPVSYLISIESRTSSKEVKFDPPLASSEKKSFDFIMEDEIKIMHIQPFILDKGEKIMCEQSFIMQEMDCPYSLPS